MPFFYLECHYGDDNDNAIRDHVIEAPCDTALWIYLEREAEKFPGHMIDGDGESLTCLYHSEGDACSSGDDSDCYDSTCDADHRTFHHDFYLMSKHETESEADAKRAPYHGQSALIRVDDAGKEINDGP